MSLIVDASVAVKWYLPEDDSPEAERILFVGDTLVAPELVLAEVGNAVWKRILKNEVAGEEATQIIDRAASAFGLLVPLLEIAHAAMDLSVALKHPIYDCFYLALAAREGSPLVTADRRLPALGESIGVKVALLSDGAF